MYDGTVIKTLKERAKKFGIATDLPADNRKERRKNLKEVMRKPEKDKPIQLVFKKFYGSKKKYRIALKAIKEKIEGK